ncbi:response regulator transcription factor [Schleiferilactobacillus harbinensis]|uniref:response regulator transcription factor n=1 Tax=Schleiferilactobacillus harbinensis TaxID=304207 RepID=UPI00123AFA92|nr:response regulator transcription factor [Schleiferilactobacillus harbinensis]QEU48819.1 response regulator transcription factor [Schleiferilactobacillus harbinensis]
MKTHRILLVEDDLEVGKLVQMALQANDYGNEWAHNGSQAETLIASYRSEVILLDLGLPDIDGTVIIQQVRQTSATPIIVISARGEESDKINALDLGADDYLIKPFSVAELLARIRVALRRNRYLVQQTATPVATQYSNGALRIDYDAQVVTLSGTPIHLTAIEYALLAEFSRNADKVLTHHYLLTKIWGAESTSDTSSLRVAVATLRRKIEAAPNAPQFIQTYIGVGYRLVQQPEE